MYGRRHLCGRFYWLRSTADSSASDCSGQFGHKTRGRTFAQADRDHSLQYRRWGEALFFELVEHNVSDVVRRVESYEISKRQPTRPCLCRRLKFRQQPSHCARIQRHAATTYSLETSPLAYCRVATCMRWMSRISGPKSGTPSPIRTGTRVIMRR